MKIPDTVIIELRDELKLFRYVVCKKDLPHVDMEAAIQQITDAILDIKPDGSNYGNLGNVGYEMAFREALFENASLHYQDKKNIMDAVFAIGDAIKNKLKHLHAYRNGHLPYRYRRMIDESTILLAKSCE